MGKSFEELMKDIGDPLPEGVSEEDFGIAREMSVELINDLEEEYPTKDELERSLDSIYLVLDFTWETYQGTVEGPGRIRFA